MAIISCSECGGQVSDKAAACPHCGAPIASVTPTPELHIENRIPMKSTTIAALLCLFLGFLGTHYFYLGKKRAGFVLLLCNLLLCWTILVPIMVCVICILDLISILRGKEIDAWGRSLV